MANKRQILVPLGQPVVLSTTVSPLVIQSLSTGWKDTPPIFTVNGGDANKFDMSEGDLEFVDNTTSPPTIQVIPVAAQTAITPALLASETATFYSVGIAGTLVPRNRRLTNAERRDEAEIGIISHIDNVNIDAIVNKPQLTINVASRLMDLGRAIGFFSTDGNEITVASGLDIQKETGSGYDPNQNADVNVKDPDAFVMPFNNASSMVHITQTVVVDHVGANIDPTIYDNGGVVTTVPSNNNATIGRVYIFSNNSLVFMLGQEVYTNFADAKEAALSGSDSFVLPTDISDAGLLLARIVVKKNATDLTDVSEALIVRPATVGGGGGSLTSMKQSYDISVEPEILLTSTRGAVTYQMYVGGNTTDAFEILNDLGVQSFAVTGIGNVTLDCDVTDAIHITRAFAEDVRTRYTNNNGSYSTGIDGNTGDFEIKDLTNNKTAVVVRQGTNSFTQRMSATEVIFNDGNFDTDFIIKKNSSGNAYKYDAGTGLHAFEGAMTVDSLTYSEFLGAIGTLTISIAVPVITLSPTDTGDAALKLGSQRAGVGTSFTDYIGDETYTTYGLRIIRNGGENADSEILHRGTGDFIINTEEFSDVVIKNNLVVEAQVYSQLPSTLTPSGTTQNIDWSDGNGSVVDLGSATGDVTLSFTNPKAGASYIIKFIQGSTFRDVVLPSSVLTPGGSAPNTLDITEVNNAIDTLTMFYDGTNYLAQLGQDFG